MRKTLVPLLLILMVVSLGISVAGCGLSGEDKALQHINRGDAYSYRMASAGEELSEALEDFFATLQGPNPETILNAGGPLERYDSALASMESFAYSAEAEYGGVLSLDGADEESEYASLMIDVARKTNELAEFIEDWFDKALDVIQTLDEGRIRSYLTGDEFEGGLADIDEIRAEINGLAGEARDYRLERDF